MKRQRVLISILATVVFITIYQQVSGWILARHVRKVWQSYAQPLEKRQRYWESLIDSELPTGTTKEKVEQWIKQRNLNLQWVSHSWYGDNFFYGTVEEIPDTNFPCCSGGKTTFQIYIYMGDDGRYDWRQVRSRCGS